MESYLNSHFQDQNLLQMLVILFLSDLISLTNSIEVEGFILISSSTPQNLISSLQSYIFSIKLQTHYFTPQFQDFLSFQQQTILVDLTFRALNSHSLQNIAKRQNSILIKPKRLNSQTGSEWFFYSHPSLQDEYQAVSAVLSLFEWQSFFLISSEKYTSFSSANYFYSQNPQIEKNYLASGLKQDNYDGFLSRHIKPTGNWKILVYNGPESSINILNAMENSKMLDKGGGIIIVGRGVSEVKPGAVIVIQEGTEEAQSQSLYEFDSIQKILKYIPRDAQNIYEIRDQISKKMYKNAPYPHYSILNSDNQNQYKIVGRIEGGKTNLTSELFLPGGYTQFTKEKIELKISLNSGIFNYNQQINIYNYIYFAGVIVMINEINSSDDLLPNFILTYQQIQCGAVSFNYKYFETCLQQYQLGIFYVLSYWQSVIQGTYQLLQDLGRNLPNIGTQAFPQLIDKEEYPLLAFTVGGRYNRYNSIPTLLYKFNWNKVIVIDSDQNQKEYIDNFIQNCQLLNIKVLNDQNKRIFESNYTLDSYQDYLEWFQHYYDLNLKIFVIFSDFFPIYEIIASLFKFGFRRNDIQIISTVNLSLVEQVLLDSSLNITQIQELTAGSIAWVTAEYQSQWTSSIIPSVLQLIHPQPVQGTGYTVDSLLIGVYALDELIWSGRDYNDKNIMNESIRVQRFEGSTGVVSIDSSSNQRRDVLSMVGSNILQEDNLIFEQKGTHLVIGNPPLDLFDEFVFPDGTNNSPGIYRKEDWGCDFDKKDVRESEESRNVAMIIIVLVSAVSMILLLVLNKRVLRREIDQETSHGESFMIIQDLILIVSIPIESIQYMLLGPKFQEFNATMYQILLQIFLDFIDLNSSSGEEYWFRYKMYYIVISVILFFIILEFFSKVVNLPEFVENIVQITTSKLLPLICSVLFIPIAFDMLSVFRCEESIGESITDSYLVQDCHTWCWKGKHLAFSIISSILLFLFYFLTTQFKIFYYKFQYSTLLQSPRFVIFNSFFQIVFLGMNFGLKQMYPSVFNISFTLTILLYFVSVFKSIEYNYRQIWVLRVSMTGCVLWSSFLGSIYREVYHDSNKGVIQYLFLSLQFIGWLFFCISGFFYKRKLRNIFKVPQRHKTVYRLFRFMFGKVNSGEISVYHQNYHLRSTYGIEESVPIEEIKQNVLQESKQSQIEQKFIDIT